MRLQKEQQIETANKNSKKSCEKLLPKPQSQTLPLEICSIEPVVNANNVICDFSLLIIRNKKTQKRKKGQN